MLKVLTGGLAALAFAGLALGATVAPAEAATITYSMHTGPAHGGAMVTVGSGYHHHHRHRVRVCTTHWHHHHRVRVCTMVWKY